MALRCKKLRYPFMTYELYLEKSGEHATAVNKRLCDGLYKDPNHPMFNFIFQYFHFKPKVLFQYSPGIETVLDHRIPNLKTIFPAVDNIVMEDEQRRGFTINPSLAAFTDHRLRSLRGTLQLLQNSYERGPSYSCFGLHEWAMLYRKPEKSAQSHCSSIGTAIGNDIPRMVEIANNCSRRESGGSDENSNSIISKGSNSTTRSMINSSSGTSSSTGNSNSNRHQNLPTRLSDDEIAAVVDSRVLRCTHYDAYRFFTAGAAPLNRITPCPSRELQGSLDQPGCLHVHMDLFKWAIKLYPFIPSELLLDVLRVALRAREIDVRASPYDLTAYIQPSGHRGLGGDFNDTPILIETTEGRREYVKHQEALYHESQPVRYRLIDYYEKVLEHYPIAGSVAQ